MLRVATMYISQIAVEGVYAAFVLLLRETIYRFSIFPLRRVATTEWFLLLTPRKDYVTKFGGVKLNCSM